MAEVLVVGAGPTGLMLAAELARRGVPFRVLDKALEPTQLSKAIAVHARTLEILHDMGIADELISRGVKLRGTQVFADGKTLVRASFDELDSHYPFILAVAQRETEAVLAEHLTKLGGVIERGVELTELTQDDDGVTCTLTKSDGSDEKLRVKYVVGADGASSTVRKRLGLDFAGSSYSEQFVLADVRVRWDLPDDCVSAFFSHEGVLAVFPLPKGRTRLIASTTVSASDEVRAPSLDEIRTRYASASHVAAEMDDPEWLASFRLHCRQVDRYQVGRVFLAGDAAHIHSPVGGQGMNTGMQDAHNLAWKLALVCHGKSKPELLDSYQAERHAIAANVLRGTDVATRAATLRHPVARAVRNHVARVLSSFEIVQQRIARTAAELDLAYRKSPIVSEKRQSVLAARVGARDSAEEPNLTGWRDFELAPAAGDRMLDATVTPRGAGSAKRLAEIVDGRRHTLLLFDGRAKTRDGYARLTKIGKTVGEKYRDLIDVHVVVPASDCPSELDWDGSLLFDPEGELEERYGASAECAYLIRPDLYVGYRSQPADEESLLAHLSKTFSRI
jgi:2-polyprenyl-6-methoxyphenol hydroxylase-like FAD-dependent oxidoreductase